MAAAVGHDSPKQGCGGGERGHTQLLLGTDARTLENLDPFVHVPRYAAIIDLTRELNDAPNTPADTQAATVSILKSLFPPWLPGAFAVSYTGFCLQDSCIFNGLNVCHRCGAPTPCLPPAPPGDVLQALPHLLCEIECLGHSSHLPVADGALLGRGRGRWGRSAKGRPGRESREARGLLALHVEILDSGRCRYGCILPAPA